MLWPWRKRSPDRSENGKARRRANRRGHVAELCALIFLMAKGYRPLARRFSVSGGELDLVMKRGSLIAFVEVKARRDIESAIHAVDTQKQRKLKRAVNVWLARNPWACAYSLRMDTLYVIGGFRIRHDEDAFDLG